VAVAKPQVGLSLMLEADFLRAAYPLFEAGAVEILEWSFDCGWPPAVVPAWADELLRCYSDGGNLLGHGVSYSPLSAGADDLQETWLRLLKHEVQRRRYRHISEHFGFSSTRNFHQSAPLPVPLTDAYLRLGQESLRELAATAEVPIGLENLAFAFSMRDVEDQGRFLDELLEPVDGFLLLDLHNLYCQVVNFDISFDALIGKYPLERVREVHVSGGSWSEPERQRGAKPIRRDTHDGPLPEALFTWLPTVLERCPRVEAVIMERMGGTLAEADDEPFRRDFRRLKEVVHGAR
jgi:uncharacterized protein (UPF0276 family)